MTPIFPPLSPWSIPSPKILLNLTHLPKKSTHPFIYRAYFHEMLNSFSHCIICFTDGFKIHNRGFAYSINDKIVDCGHRNTTCVFTAELQAIFQCLTSILSLPASHSNSSLIISDSLYALATISDSYSSLPIRVVTRIFTLLTTFNSITLTVSFMWVLSILGNEKVDAATKAVVNHFRTPHHTSSLVQIGRIKSVFLMHSRPLSQQIFRKHGTYLTRLHIGHTLCHSLTPTIQFFPLTCLHCTYDSLLIVRHIFSRLTLTTLRNSPKYLTSTFWPYRRIIPLLAGT